MTESWQVVQTESRSRQTKSGGQEPVRQIRSLSADRILEDDFNFGRVGGMVDLSDREDIHILPKNNQNVTKGLHF